MVKHSGMLQCIVLQTHWEHLVLKGYSSSMPSQAVIPLSHFMELPRKWCGKCGEAQMFSEHFLWSFQTHQARLPMTLERFVVLLYKRTPALASLKQARKTRFASGRQLDHIPPTSGALLQHTKRAVYQAEHVWGKTLIANPSLQDPTEWGWTRDVDLWCPVWSLKSDVSKACRYLIKCSCRNSHSRKCKKAGLPCTVTLLCFCEGECTWRNQFLSDG